MRSHTGVALRMFRSLSDAGINVDLMSTSEVRVNVLVDGTAGPTALACLKKTFGTIAEDEAIAVGGRNRVR